VCRSLALDGLHHTTSWITLADGKGRFLSDLELQLTATGDAVTAFRWEAQYVDTQPPPYISVRSVWSLSVEWALGEALGLLFLVVVLVLLLLGCLTCGQHGALAVDQLVEGTESDDDGRRLGQRTHTDTRTRQQHAVAASLMGSKAD
jgi:hypothetical protein